MLIFSLTDNINVVHTDEGRMVTVFNDGINAWTVGNTPKYPSYNVGNRDVGNGAGVFDHNKGW